MKLLDTKIGKILWTDCVEILVNKVCLVMYEKEQNKQREKKEKLIEYKKINGLTEEERLSPVDSKCNYDYVKNVEVLNREPYVNEKGEQGTIIHQRVTYIDDSMKDFNIHMVLSGLQIPDDFDKIKEKVLSKNQY